VQNFKYEILGQNADPTPWWHVVDVFNHIDPERVLCHPSYSINPTVLKPKYKYVIKSLGYEETPRFDELVQWCQMNPEVQFICLGDIDVYDWVYPDNLQFVDYRFFYCELAQLLELFRHTLVPVKNKTYKYKFSSLSHRLRQFRAVVTAKLLSVAKDDSIISWHNQDNMAPGIHSGLIESVMHMDCFKDLDWSFLHKTTAIDNWDSSYQFKDHPHSILDARYPAYQEAFVNINNESFWFGWHHIDKIKHMTPGPYISDKTWKCISTGTMFINNGQPNTYNFLHEKYGIPFNFDIDLEFDTIPGDIDRMRAVLDTIDQLVVRDLSDIIDANIEACEQMQQWILQPGLVQSFVDYNKKQDEYILELVSR